MKPDMENDEGNPDKPITPNDKKKKVGNYLLGKTIGEGAFAKVRQAVHVIAREKVAIKVVSKKAILLREYVRRNVCREAAMLQRLQHANIIRLYEVMETQNTYYLVLEYLEGGDFLRYLTGKNFLTEFECRKYMRQICSAVDHMHRSSIVHRDIKLENFLLDKDLNLKIIDFGLSNTFFGDVSLSTQCGSPAYAAPEIFANQKYGAAVDIWSIGVCMYAMLVGNLPFVPPSANNLAQLHALILKGVTLPDYLSEECTNILERLLQVDCRKRIKIEDVLKHAWISPAYEDPLIRQPTLPNLTLPPPQGTVINYMTTMYGHRESDVVTALEDRKVNSTTAAYHLLQKRFDSGLHLVGFSVDSPQVKRKLTNSAPLQEIHTYSGKIPAGINTPTINPSSYKNYMQYVNDSKERNTSRAKQRDTNLLLQRQKTAAPVLAPSKYTGKLSDNSYGYMYYPDFRLTCSPTQDHMYEWSSEAMTRIEDCNLSPKRSIHFENGVEQNGDLRIPHSVDGDFASGDSPLVPPNTSQGPRPVTVDEYSEYSYQQSGTSSVVCKSPLPSKPISTNKLTKTQRRMPNRNTNESRASSEKDKMYINMSDQVSLDDAWGPVQKQKAKIAKGVTLALSRSKTMYAKSISSQKYLTPRLDKPSLDDMRQAQIIGKGRIMVERSAVSRSISSLPDYTKPRTAIGAMREKFPDVVNSTRSARASSDCGPYPQSDIAHLPDVVGVNTEPPVTPPTPVEKLIADDEAPMMRIRITGFEKV